MNRKPPAAVRRQLRREVGFGCPVSGCGNPYLRWHHFDPPWSTQQHHNPDGMVALCGTHHDMADVGAYTEGQLRKLKRSGAERAGEAKGRFEWMRHSLLAVVGGNFYYETPVIFQFRNEPIIWFNRDEEGYLLLNIRMLSTSGQPRMLIEDNFWLTQGDPDDLESPPSGKLLSVRYSNGDRLRVEFYELKTLATAQKRYSEADPNGWEVPFPMTAVEVQNRVGGTDIEFGPRQTSFGGVVISNCFAANCGAGIVLD
jgi:hypothetical protein